MYWQINKILRNLRNFHLLVLCSLRARGLVGRCFAVRIEDDLDFASPYCNHLGEGDSRPCSSWGYGAVRRATGPSVRRGRRGFGKEGSTP